MFTSIIELSGTKIAECNEICQILIEDEYESSNMASWEGLGLPAISILITQDMPIYQLLKKLLTSLSLTQ